MEKCLEIVALNETSIRMDFCPEKAVIPLDVVFDDFFSRRNEFFGEEKKFRKDRTNYVEYNFSLEEFSESFFGIFTPEYMGYWMGQHLVEGDWEEEFVGKVKDFEKKNNVLFTLFHRSWHWNAKGRLYFFPKGIEVKEVNDIIKESCRKLPKDEQYKNNHLTRKDIKVYHEKQLSNSIFYEQSEEGNLSRLRENLWKLKSGVLYAHSSRKFSLDYFDLINCYKMNTSNLKIVRK